MPASAPAVRPFHAWSKPAAPPPPRTRLQCRICSCSVRLYPQEIREMAQSAPAPAPAPVYVICDRCRAEAAATRTR